MIKNALSSVSLACLEINFDVKGAGTFGIQNECYMA